MFQRVEEDKVIWKFKLQWIMKTIILTLKNNKNVVQKV